MGCSLSFLSFVIETNNFIYYLPCRWLGMRTKTKGDVPTHHSQMITGTREPGDWRETRVGAEPTYPETTAGSGLEARARRRDGRQRRHPDLMRGGRIAGGAGSDG